MSRIACALAAVSMLPVLAADPSRPVPLREGADFQELARQHSKDSSAANGGDMGYQHKGMLPEPAQVALDKLKPGEVSDAVLLLEGVAIFRLDERRAARLNQLDAVRARARDLWKRDKGEEAWTQLLAKLRSETPGSVRTEGFRSFPISGEISKRMSVTSSAMGVNEPPSEPP